MEISNAERKIRMGLPIIRLITAYLPLPIAYRLLKLGMARVQLDDNVTREAVSAAGVPCDWLIPANSQPDRVLIYLHGGGFVYGQTPTHLQMGAYLAEQMGVRVLMVDYRVAPAHPFPAPLDDCVTVYRWLRQQGVAAQNIVMAGDSAGGNLTIASLMQLRDSGDPLPAAAACLSPVIDLTNKKTAFKAIRDPVLHPRAGKRFNRSYTGANDAHNPLISPAFGNWEGLPPLLIHAGEDEVLRDDALRSEALAQAAGVAVRLEIYPRMWHVWQINLDLPQAVQSLTDIAQFLTSHLD